MKKVIVIGGSSSKNSISKQLAVYTSKLISNVEISIIDLKEINLPIFSIDFEEEGGIPTQINELNLLFDKADGFIVSLAEHNGAYSAAFKNMFDWLSILNGKVWREKPMILLATSPGERGGQTVLEIAKSRFPYNGGNIIGSMSFPSFNDNFKDNKVVNSNLKNTLDTLVVSFNKALQNG